MQEPSPTSNPLMQVQKLPTGIEGFDDVCHGGLPIGRSTLISGTLCAILAGFYQLTLEKSIILSFFLTMVLKLNRGGYFAPLELLASLFCSRVPIVITGAFDLSTAILFDEFLILSLRI
jgi:hypothetical protein